MLQRGSDKVEKIIRECGQRSTATEKYQPTHFRSASRKLQFPFCTLKTT